MGLICPAWAIRCPLEERAGVLRAVHTILWGDRPSREHLDHAANEPEPVGDSRDVAMELLYVRTFLAHPTDHLIAKASRTRSGPPSGNCGSPFIITLLKVWANFLKPQGWRYFDSIKSHF